MWKRRFCQVCLLGLGAVVIWTIFVLLTPSTEPTYKRQRLSQWIGQLPEPNADMEPTEAERAVRAIGANGVPYLLKWISYEPPPWKMALYRSLGTILIKGPKVSFQDRQMLRAAGAAKAFVNLGPEVASGATNSLSRMTRDTKLGVSRAYATYASWLLEHRPSHPLQLNVYRGAEAIGLSYTTNGIPVLTHGSRSTNSMVVPPVAPTTTSAGKPAVP